MGGDSFRLKSVIVPFVLVIETGLILSGVQQWAPSERPVRMHLCPNEAQFCCFVGVPRISRAQLSECALYFRERNGMNVYDRGTV